MQMTVGAFELLAADGPFPPLAEQLALFGQFVGSWEMESTWFGDGPAQHGRGEWHFAWALGGRAVQDVLFAKGAARHEYGTTLRVYDAGIDAWRCVWMHPRSGEYVALIARATAEGILLEGRWDAREPLQRWTFTEITDQSFLWQGRSSRDGGASWTLDQEMRGVRR